MFRRPLRILLLTFFVCAIGMLGAARAQTESPSLEPQAQTISATAFDDGRQEIVGGPDGIEPTAPSGSAETTPTQAPAPFTYLMLRWRATTTDEHLVELEVRASEDGHSWTDWGEIHPNADLVDPNDDPDVYWSNTIYTGLANFWQLRVTLNTGDDGSVPVLHEVRVLTTDARGDDPAPSAPTADPSLGAPDAAVSRPSFVSRTSWGGSEVLNNSVAPRWYTANHMVAHHTADQNSLRSGERTWADRVRAIWAFHTYPSGRGWGDVGYNWLISPNGVIYEGRNGSSDGSRDSVAFHDTGNYGSMGVVLLGTFGPGVAGVTPIRPSADAQTALVQVFAWKASQRNINPLGSSFYYGCSISRYCAPFNAGSVVPNIAGHRQVTPGHTSCPGDLGMEIMDSIRTRVRDALAGAPPPTAAPPTPVPPTPIPPTPTVPAKVTRAELTNVEYVGSPVSPGGVIQVRFTIRNTGNTSIETQEPSPGRTDDLAPGHVYAESECFGGNAAGTDPAFPSVGSRLRVVLGGADGGGGLGDDCVYGADGYPWRWGVGTTLQPGQSRTVVGYVRFGNPTGNPRTITLRAGLVYENITFFARDVFQTTIAVAPDSRGPELSITDDNTQPLAAVYHLAPAPDSLALRSEDPASAQEGGLVGRFAWDGAAQNWGDGGPAGVSDKFVVLQTRAFMAPESGVYSFESTSDDGSWLWIDGRLVVDNSGGHGSTSVSGSTWLQAGIHVLAVKYFEHTGGAFARYSWVPPGSRNWTTVPVLRSAGAPQRGLVYGSGQQFVITADDIGGRGTQKIEYFVDGGGAQEQTDSILTLSLGHGDHWIWYRAMDTGGAWSPDQLVLVRVDARAPVTVLSAAPQPNGVLTLTWTSDSDAIYFDIQSNDKTAGKVTTFRSYQQVLHFFGEPGHSYELKIRASDGMNLEQFGGSVEWTVPSKAQFRRLRLPFTSR